MNQESINLSRPQDSSFRWIPIAMLYLASIASGIVQCFTAHPSVFAVIALFMAVSGIYWVQLDARHRQHPIPQMALLLVMMAWMLFVPIYLIWARGIRGFGWALLHVVGLYAATLASFFTTLLLIYGPQVFQA